MSNSYSIGLDIGVSSIGWTIVDEDGHLMRVKGKTGIGVRLFTEGKSAAERRSFRTTRRRLKRIKWRLRLLREIFDEPISQIDPNFFARRKYADVSPQDPNYNGLAKALFNDRTDKEFYDAYPTIYHLRQALMTESRKFDIREIYLAIHHIVKYRGNFLRQGAATEYQTARLELDKAFRTLNDLWSQLDVELNLRLTTDPDVLSEIKAVLVQDNLSRSKKKEQIIPLLAVENAEDKVQAQLHKSIVTELAKALVGVKAKVDILTQTVISKDEQKNWSFEIINLQDNLSDIENELDSKQMELINTVASLFSAINLAQLLPEGKTFSGNMVAKYNQHGRDLALLKKYAKSQTDEKKYQAIKSTYDQYIDGKQGKNNQVISQIDFYKALGKLVDKDADTNVFAAKIKSAVANEDFMPKLRTRENGAIPYQVQQNELDQIIKNQRQYYPWLSTPNPVKKRQGKFPYKLDELVGFRVPYYVGPMVTPADQQATSDTSFSWMARKADGAITPWNFDEMVDRTTSAANFVQRMKTTDTYLLGEDVLPQQSLLYQRFEVLNELNNMRIDDQPIEFKQKQRLYEYLFKSKKVVTIKDVQDNLVNSGEYQVAPKITGLADLKRFNSGLTTYHDYKRIIPDALNQTDKQADIEKIIMWSTIFEDSEIFINKLMTIKWLNDDQRKKLSRIRYRGWGRLSKKLLMDLKDAQHQSIIDNLWMTSHNFMYLQRQPEFSIQIEAANQQILDQRTNQGIIGDLYTSPQNKKAIRQVMLVLDDIQKAMGQAPKRIFLEMARDEGHPGQRTKTRADRILAVYQSSAKEIIDTEVEKELRQKIKDKAVFEDKLVLYFLQNGHDIYDDRETGKLDIDDLDSYEIDHIIPQSLVKDDSLDNRVLTTHKHNQNKKDNCARDYYGKYIEYWNQLHRVGLISSRKLQKLMMTKREVEERGVGFIARQLVETRQVIKLVANLIDSNYTNTEVVSIKADLTHQFRQQFNYPKIREVNDYHHAFDAYLTSFIGTYLLKKYPNLKRFLIYGQFKKMSLNFKSFNLINSFKVAVDKAKKSRTDCNSEVPRLLAEIHTFNQVYKYHQRILITHEVSEHHGAMFKQTIYKATTSQLIPKKANCPTEIYGGYSQKQLAYLAIVKIPKKQGFFFEVKGIQMMMITQIDQLKKDGVSEKQAVQRVLEPLYTVKRTGKIKPFEVIVPKVRFEQLVRDELKGQSHRFMLGSDKYYHNFQELYLSLDMQRKLRSYKGDINSNLLAVFDALVHQVKTYFTLYDVNSFRAKLLVSRPKFEALSIDEKRSVLNDLFIGFHANAARKKIPVLGFTTDLGKLQTGGIKLTPDAEIIYQSPTGLFERVVALKDL